MNYWHYVWEAFSYELTLGFGFFMGMCFAANLSINHQTSHDDREWMDL